MNEIIPRTGLAELYGHTLAARAKMGEAIDAFERAAALMAEADEHAAHAHQGHVFAQVDRRNHADYRTLYHTVKREPSAKAWRDQLYASVWRRLLEQTGMAAMMDHKARAEFDAALAKDPPEPTPDTVAERLRELFADHENIFRRGLAGVFSSLDRRFKSHDAFRFESRVIINHLCDGDGHLRYNTDREHRMNDIERALSVLDGQAEGFEPSLMRAIRDARQGRWGPAQTEVETPYLRIRVYKNGNAHLWFTRKDLVKLLNEQLATYYGAVLPDAVPDDVSAERCRSTALSRDLAFYRSPEAVARAVAEAAYVRAGDVVLEPSAGDGALVRAVAGRGVVIDAIEVDPDRARQLRALGPILRSVRQDNFLKVAPVRLYTRIVMNPPFSGTHWMAHVRHAHDFLVQERGSTLVAVLPVTAELGDTTKHEEFRAWVNAHGGRFRDLPQASFASSGTNVSTVILTMGA